jgi:nucleoside 2-deoxyribosyltransferase
MKKIYIAGFEVFKKDAIKIGLNYKEICKKQGFSGLYPLDNEITGSDVEQIKNKIWLENMKQILSSDIVIANLNPFRGAEPDSGTIWECAFAFGNNKIVYGYYDSNLGTSIIDRVKKSYNDNVIIKNDCFYDKDGCRIENLNSPVNLMLSHVRLVEGNFTDCVKQLKEDINNNYYEQIKNNQNNIYNELYNKKTEN